MEGFQNFLSEAGWDDNPTVVQEDTIGEGHVLRGDHGLQLWVLGSGQLDVLPTDGHGVQLDRI